MDFSDTVKLLHKYGLPLHAARNAAIAMKEKSSARVAVIRARDWEYLLKPLRRAIVAKQGNKKVWEHDPLRCDLYTNYLALMLKVRAKIYEAKALNLDDKTLPEIARERNLSGNGLHWSHWVPRKVHAAFLQAFDELNHHPDRPRIGKRAIPFTTQLERTASDTRWERLIVQINAEILGRKGGFRDDPLKDTLSFGPQDGIIKALEQALDVAYARDAEDVAPVQWIHLLTKEQRAALDAWRMETCNGVVDAPRQSPMTEAQELVEREAALMEMHAIQQLNRREQARERALDAQIKSMVVEQALPHAPVGATHVQEDAGLFRYFRQATQVTQGRAQGETSRSQIWYLWSNGEWVQHTISHRPEDLVKLEVVKRRSNSPQPASPDAQQE